jgi:hypothetical protein
MDQHWLVTSYNKERELHGGSAYSTEAINCHPLEHLAFLRWHNGSHVALTMVLKLTSNEYGQYHLERIQ